LTTQLSFLTFCCGTGQKGQHIPWNGETCQNKCNSNLSCHSDQAPRTKFCESLHFDSKMSFFVAMVVYFYDAASNYFLIVFLNYKLIVEKYLFLFFIQSSPVRKHFHYLLLLLCVVT
jgi:hypothetical protein